MFYDRLVDLCQKNGIKVTNLVSELNLSSGNLSKWKMGGQPKGDTLHKIADRFGVTTDYLLGRTDDPGPAARAGDKTAPSPEDWARAFSELSTDKLMEVQEIMLKEFGIRIKGGSSDQ